MFENLKIILEIQELDMNMISLVRLKRQRQKELQHIDRLRNDLKEQLEEKEKEIADLSHSVVFQENKITEIEEKLKKLEVKQSSVKKVDEFNALTQEMTSCEREKVATEQIASDLIDKRNLEEEILTKIQESLRESEEGSKALEEEIYTSIKKINVEGSELKEKRELLSQKAPSELLRIYERLLYNKKDRVVVPIENRACSGCHIALTAQHENLVRKGERLIFCEHCSRIHYWIENEDLESSSVTGKKRRRRRTASV